MTRSDKELIKKIYNAQKEKPIKDDWYLTVQKDKEYLNMSVSDNEIKSLRKTKFKKLVKLKIKKKALEYLNLIKKSHSKGKETVHETLEIQEYIKTEKLSKKQKSLLYNLRFRMTKVKMNFKNMFNDKVCDLCKKEDDSLQHCLECTVLLKECPDLYNDRIVRYEDLFGNLSAQIRAVKLFEKVLEKREELLDN